MQTSGIFIFLSLISLLAIPGFLIATLVRKGQRMKMLKLAGVSTLVFVVSGFVAVWMSSVEREQDKTAAEEGGFESVEEYQRAKSQGYTTKEAWGAAVQELEERVAKVPASDYEENIRLYNELRKLDPDNDRYEQKISYYENKREEARVAKQAELRRKEERAKQVRAEANVTYKIVEENIDDTPIKTQIEQHIVASGAPTKAELEAEILRRYRAAATRRGFRYNDRATNIYIYVYGTEDQARAGQGLWIGMIAKGPVDRGEPRLRFSEQRLAALSKAPEERFGLSEEERKQVYREIIAGEDRASRHARARIPDSLFRKQGELKEDLIVAYEAKVAQQHGLTSDKLDKIAVEGIEKGWPSPSPGTDPYTRLERSVYYRISEETPLMPTMRPSDPMAAIRAMKYISAGYTIEIVGSRTNDHGILWYEVVVWDSERNRSGAGWINSTALRGQELESVQQGRAN